MSDYKHELFNVTKAITDYEEGNISEERYYELFQYLVDSGMAWELQGFYGRQAAMMLEEGYLLPPDREKPAESKEEPSMTKPKRKSRSKKQVGALVKMKSRKIAGLGIILARVDDLPHDEHPDYGPMMIEMKNKGVAFTVHKCVNSTANENHCHSPEEIEKYIEDVTLDYWSIENKMDLSIF